MPTANQTTNFNMFDQNNQIQAGFTNTTPASTGNNLASLKVKVDYNDQEWKQREQAYSDEIDKIHIDASNLTPNEIAVAASRIDAILTPLRLDNVYAQKASTKYESDLKLQNLLLYNTVKKNAQGTKLTVDETKSLIAEHINQNPWENTGENLFKLCERYGARKIFTEQAIKILQDKKDLLITYSGVLKIESSVSGFTQSVPTANQMPDMRQ